MKYSSNSRPRMSRKTNIIALNWLALAALGALLLSPNPAKAGVTELLVNTNFGANTGRNIPTGWTIFVPPEPNDFHTNDYWIGGPPTGGFYATALSGTQYWKQWGMGYFSGGTNAVGGIYQTFGSSPGSVYQAAGWFYTATSDEMGANSYAWVDVSFLDANDNILALYQSSFFTYATGEDSWYEFPVTNQCNISDPIPTGDPYYTNYAVSGSVSQLVAPPGTTQVRYRFNYLQGGSDGGSCYLDDPYLTQFSGLVPPVITNVFPQNMIFVPPQGGLTFDVSSPSGSTINNSAIQLILNGTNASSGLTITGSSSNKQISYFGLQSNSIYTCEVTATDQYNLSGSTSNYFQTTWVGIPPILYLWEAEDFDFNGGMYYDDPLLCNVAGETNCYYGVTGVFGVDENYDGESTSHLYRPNDYLNIDVSGDYLRENLFLADRTDYELNPFEQGEWANYTRDFTNGTYWIIGRLATDIGLSGSVTASVVNSDGSTTELGTFSIKGGQGWTTFENVYLLDTNGNKANVTLNGKTTLRMTSGGNLLPNFFALVAATVDQPILSGLYPTGTHPFEYTNSLSFNLLTVGASFPPNSIQVILDGLNVSSNLIITGSSNVTVVYTNLLLNAPHTAIISATNSLGHGVLVTNNFDTFNPNNYIFYASDFDFNGGQSIPDSQWYPNAYQGEVSVTNIDFQHTTIGGEQYPYRPNGIPQEQGSDYLTPIFVDYGGIEYDLGDYGPGDWQNYTRTFTNGVYYIYARTAGLNAFSMTLQKVVSGAGMANQTVETLGQWSGVGVNNQTYQWVELTDSGLTAPKVVDLNGQMTLRVTTPTGDVYPNYFMLVPAGGARIAAAKQGAGVVLSFQSQAGVVYRVLYRSSLTSGTWTLYENVLGTGGEQSVAVSPGSGTGFYQVVAP